MLKAFVSGFATTLRKSQHGCGDERAVSTTPHIHASTRLIHPFSTMGIWGMRVNLSKPCKRPARVGRGSYEAW
ncbi:hypothetical protein CGGC5_v000528 [Colletotrichum fructicola Nara gc5]|uniref:Uncharacterized protein n=1 Tax=Colletotrichum fructicola (strain Nara gc5) TaxID=1213859 RepID=A0A7J6JMT4_COLFN|nr:hypothetical protein CGGC5_v000528 [Colletotrichum fructicola Nara gc5]KAF4904851.1 hypothetical protein CGCFRS4_v000961 [Colletotrichum fructicola]